LAAGLNPSFSKTAGGGATAVPSLPPRLPCIKVVIAPEDLACPCCGGAMHMIGEDIAERLEWFRPSTA